MFNLFCKANQNRGKYTRFLWAFLNVNKHTHKIVHLTEYIQYMNTSNVSFHPSSQAANFKIFCSPFMVLSKDFVCLQNVNTENTRKQIESGLATEGPIDIFNENEVSEQL